MKDSDKYNTIETKDGEKSKFVYKSLRYKDAEWKNPAYGVCYYRLRNPLYYWKSGNVYLKFTKIDEGIRVHVNAGSDVRNMTVNVIPYNRSATVD